MCLNVLILMPFVIGVQAMESRLREENAETELMYQVKSCNA